MEYVTPEYAAQLDTLAESLRAARLEHLIDTAIAACLAPAEGQ